MSKWCVSFFAGYISAAYQGRTFVRKNVHIVFAKKKERNKKKRKEKKRKKKEQRRDSKVTLE